MDRERRRLLAAIVGFPLASALIPFVRAASVFAASDTVLSLTEQQASLEMQGEEVVGIGSSAAYGGPYAGFHFFKNGSLVLAPASSVPLSPGDTVSWVGVDAATNEGAATLLSFQVPVRTPQAVPPSDPQPAPVPAAPPPVAAVAVPQVVPSLEPEAAEEPQVIEEVRRFPGGFSALRWRGQDGTLIQEELRRASLASVLMGVWRFEGVRVRGFLPGAPDFAQGFLTLKDGDILILKAKGPGTWILRFKESKGS